jgi:hypothetical protein
MLIGFIAKPCKTKTAKQATLVKTPRPNLFSYYRILAKRIEKQLATIAEIEVEPNNLNE